jgi:hypothetical protein
LRAKSDPRKEDCEGVSINSIPLSLGWLCILHQRPIQNG